MCTVRTVVSLLVLVAYVSACGPDEVPVETAASDAADDGSDAASGYQVVLGNALSDTLRGEARFGIVHERNTDTERFVIRLASEFDFAGGIVLVRRDTTLPAVGSYDLGAWNESLDGAPARGFILFYREGMLRDMRASSGTLNLTTVTDTLMAGSFDASLRGRVVSLDRTSGVGVHAVGRFQARRDLDGFVIGL